ncbi:CAMK/CAMKL protein kinase [Allomyces macrogynus ATCC 38327]|uniref:CAMK/CAMKL protein kinase n=1 Tax=Allomyces macrogynus (strain ATCC 38327) TaxID=578462 RepID=A0A0L0SM70_ALLM3|nr:CAMK/CAMKL protein kinase [Allomyces macrogynus ATCC 38327]|eukprot:KNE63558.1 CAMK/CAMKL protein kinase [Allomyces macrogynus ATCC 38327]
MSPVADRIVDIDAADPPIKGATASSLTSLSDLTIDADPELDPATPDPRLATVHHLSTTLDDARTLLTRPDAPAALISTTLTTLLDAIEAVRALQVRPLPSSPLSGSTTSSWSDASLKTPPSEPNEASRHSLPAVAPSPVDSPAVLRKKSCPSSTATPPARASPGGMRARLYSAGADRAGASPLGPRPARGGTAIHGSHQDVLDAAAPARSSPVGTPHADGTLGSTEKLRGTGHAPPSSPRKSTTPALRGSGTYSGSHLGSLDSLARPPSLSPFGNSFMDPFSALHVSRPIASSTRGSSVDAGSVTELRRNGTTGSSTSLAEESRRRSGVVGGNGVGAGGGAAGSTWGALATTYQVAKVLGEGSFGETKLAMHRESKTKVAIKHINRLAIARSASAQRMVLSELVALISLDVSHPHICPLIDVVTSATTIHLVFPYLGGGELFDWLRARPSGRLGEDEARVMFAQLVDAVGYCHDKGWCHRDVKLENVMLSDDHKQCHLIDFGFATRIPEDGGMLTTPLGSGAYASPEMLQKLPYAGPDVDVWSLGIVLYTLICGRFPFRGDSPRELLQRVVSGTVTFPTGRTYSPALVDLVHRCLAVDRTARITIADMRNHAWFQGAADPRKGPGMGRVELARATGTVGEWCTYPGPLAADAYLRWVGGASLTGDV